MNWTINTVDAAGNVIAPVSDGASFYLMITGTGEWGVGYMPHLYAQGNYYGTPMTWEESWIGDSTYTGSAAGNITDLDSIANYNPIIDYGSNLVQKTHGFAGSADYNTLIVAQEQVFPGWWGGSWTEPDGEIITWIFGPFVLNSPSEFNLRILMTEIPYNTIYIADNKVSVCSNLPVMISGPPAGFYSSLQSAYNAAGNEESIYSQKIIFNENVNLDLNKSITLEGGYECDYIDSTGVTTVQGDISISNGKLTILSGVLSVQ